MISKTIGYNGVLTIFRQTQMVDIWNDQNQMYGIDGPFIDDFPS